MDTKTRDELEALCREQHAIIATLTREKREADARAFELSQLHAVSEVANGAKQAEIDRLKFELHEATDSLVARMAAPQQQAQAAQSEINAALDRADAEDAARFDAQAALSDEQTAAVANFAKSYAKAALAQRAASVEAQPETMCVKLVAREGCPEWMTRNDGDVWRVYREPNAHGCYQRTNGSWLCVPVQFADEVDTDTAPPAQPVPAATSAPEGWKLVPVEPTDAMRLACHTLNYQDEIDAEWKAMLSAAPVPAAGMPHIERDAELGRVAFAQVISTHGAEHDFGPKRVIAYAGDLETLPYRTLLYAIAAQQGEKQ